jgi:predicted RNase H-like HicB family nuclease
MRYTIDLEHDEAGWWVATARDVPGCHTQGRSIRQALSRVREAMAACVGEDVAPDELEPRVHLPAETRRVVARYESACRRLERDQKAARRATDKAVETLVDELSLSVRDAADVLGLSHQRVHQLSNAMSATDGCS